MLWGLCLGGKEGESCSPGGSLLKHFLSCSVAWEKEEAKARLQEEAFFSGARLFVSLAMQNNVCDLG